MLVVGCASVVACYFLFLLLDSIQNPAVCTESIPYNLLIALPLAKPIYGDGPVFVPRSSHFPLPPEN